MAKKFGDITGIHNVFSSVKHLLLTKDNDNDELSFFKINDLDEFSVIYFTADDTDLTLFNELGVISGIRYIWVRGKLQGSEFVTKEGTLILTGNKEFRGEITFSKDPNFPITQILPVHTYLNTEWMSVGEHNFSHVHEDGISYNIVPNACWKLNLDPGSYIIQILHSTDNDGGVYTGYFSYALGSGTNEEIILHRAGNSSTQNIFAKIKYITDGVYLQLAAVVKEEDCTELTIKIRKLL